MKKGDGGWLPMAQFFGVLLAQLGKCMIGQSIEEIEAETVNLQQSETL